MAGLALGGIAIVDYTVWISHADRALYAAKERGRNRSVRFQPMFTPRPEPT